MWHFSRNTSNNGYALPPDIPLEQQTNPDAYKPGGAAYEALGYGNRPSRNNRPSFDEGFRREPSQDRRPQAVPYSHIGMPKPGEPGFNAGDHARGPSGRSNNSNDEGPRLNRFGDPVLNDGIEYMYNKEGVRVPKRHQGATKASGNTRLSNQERNRRRAKYQRERAIARARRQQLRRDGNWKPGRTTASGRPGLGDEAGGWGNPNSPNRSH